MLKKSLILVLFWAIDSAAVAQQNPQFKFEKANQLLQQGKIEQALHDYKQLAENEQVSGALFINMGYANLELGKLGKAKYYYLKAKQFDSTQKQAAEGLDYVQSRLSHKSVILPPLPWEKALDWFRHTFGMTLLLAVGLFLIHLGVVVLALSWLRQVNSPLIGKVTAGIAALGILIMLLSFYINYRQQRYSAAVMITPQSTVMEQPAAKADSVNKAYEGYRFMVDHKKSQNHKQWIYVRMSNGSWGWIRRKEIMIL